MLKKTVMLVSLLLLGCQLQIGLKKEKEMNFTSKYFTVYRNETNETFDMATYNQKVGLSNYGKYTLDDNISVIDIVDKPSIKNDGALYILPKLNFYKIYKEFYPKSYLLKRQGKLIGDTRIGIWQEFDTTGRLVRQIDYDKKLGKHKYIDIFKFLEKKGHVDLKKGQGSRYIIVDYNDKNNTWTAIVYGFSEENYINSTYIVNADTFEVLEERHVQGGQE